MRTAVVVGSLVTVVLAGCAGGGRALRSKVDQAADPRAPVPPSAAAAFLLAPDEFDQAVTASGSAATEDSAAGPTQPTQVKASAHEHAGRKPSQPSTLRPGSIAPPQGKRAEPVIFACPMHPDVTDSTASTCPNCGMTLE